MDASFPKYEGCGSIVISRARQFCCLPGDDVIVHDRRGFATQAGNDPAY